MTNLKSNGGKFSDLLAELKAEYREGFPSKVERLQELFLSRDWTSLTREFHNLKGSGRTYGYPEVSQIFEPLEDYCRKGQVDAAQIEILFPVLARLQEAWNNGRTFNPADDPEAKRILALKGP